MNDNNAVRPNTIRVVTQSFNGPPEAEVQTFDQVYPTPDVWAGKKLSAEEIEVKFTTLLTQAAHSGFNVTVSNESDPCLGMGGYRPKLEVRPNYQAVRAEMSGTPATISNAIPTYQQAEPEDIAEAPQENPGDWLQHKP
jgi:hypothetical protein